MLKLSIERTDAIVPPPTWNLNPQSEVWRDVQGQICAYAEVLDNEYWMHLPGLASFRFSCCAEQVVATTTRTVAEDLVRETYHREVLPMALHVCGREILHASAVRSSIGVTAFCGVSETGKSTIAFGLSRRGYTIWADDVVVWEVSHFGAQAMSLPFTVRLRPSSAAVFDLDKTSSVATAAGDKRTQPGAQSERVNAICVLRRADEGASTVAVRRLSFTEGFAALLDHSCCFAPQDHLRKRRMIHNYLDVAAAIPIFDVSFKSGLENLPAIFDAIEELIEQSGT